MTDAFDADVLIYAAIPAHALGERVAALFRAPGPAGVGSLLLLPELLSTPLRTGATEEAASLASFVEKLELVPVDRPIAELAVALGAAYRLRTVEAIHLASAVASGARRFVTNNSRDFPKTIAEVEVVYPADLPAAA